MTPMSDRESDSASHASSASPAALPAADGGVALGQSAETVATDAAVMLAHAEASPVISPVGEGAHNPLLVQDDMAHYMTHDGMMGDHAMDDHSVTFNLVDASGVAAHGNGLGPSFDQEGVTLSLDDVLDIGTETVGDLQALVVTGDHGDIVRLQSDAAHSWQVAEGIDAPDGFVAYQAIAPLHEAADATPMHHSGNADVYVLVQHDLQVMLTNSAA